MEECQMVKRKWKARFLIAGALGAAAMSAVAGQITLYGRTGFQGPNLTTTSTAPNLVRSALNDVASSIVVTSGTWEACTEAYFRGRCALLPPGNYSNVSGELTAQVASVRQFSEQPASSRVTLYPDAAPVVAAPVIVSPAPAQVVVPEQRQVVVVPEQRQVVVSAPVVTAPVVTSQVVTTPVVTAPIVTTPVVTAVPIPTGARVTLYQHKGHLVRAVELTSSIDNLDRRNFEDSADSAMVSGGVWRLCDSERGRGTCTDFQPGQYDSLGALNGRVRSAYLVTQVQERVATVATVPPGRAIVYEFPNFGGAPQVIEYGRAPDMAWTNFRNPASSVRIESGSWLVCSDIGYQGECRVLEPGEYPYITGMGGIASARQVWRPQYQQNPQQYGSLDLRRQSTP